MNSHPKKDTNDLIWQPKEQTGNQGVSGFDTNFRFQVRGSRSYSSRFAQVQKLTEKLVTDFYKT